MASRSGLIRPILLIAAVAAIAAGAWVLVRERSPDSGAEIARGRSIYAEFCASCHGANLEGQPDWQTRMPNGRMPAPPHDETGHTWHHPDQDLFRIVNEGVAAIVPGYETDMPAFGTVLTDGEIIAVLNYIKGTWPEEQRDYQTARTADRTARDGP
jgi:mono/diheme cytochrome c family protein